MRTILGTAAAVAALTAFAHAEERYILRQDQTGLTLPGVSLPQNSDEVRAADGTSCRSSNGGSGAYADIGVISTKDEYGSMDPGAVYGRIVIPLGRQGTRLDCRRLYDLEIQRLQMEVRLLKAGLNKQSAGASEPKDHRLSDESWTNGGQ